MFEDLDNFKGFTISRLRSLVLVADAAGSLTHAAKGDRTKQTQLSGDLKELGAFFEVELVQAKQQLLTEAGTELARVGREFFQSLAEFNAATKGKPIEVRIGAGDRLLHWILLPKLGRIQAELP